MVQGSKCPCLSSRLGQGSLPRSLPTSIILWFCEMLEKTKQNLFTKVKSYLKQNQIQTLKVSVEEQRNSETNWSKMPLLFSSVTPPGVMHPGPEESQRNDQRSGNILLWRKAGRAEVGELGELRLFSLGREISRVIAAFQYIKSL